MAATSVIVSRWVGQNVRRLRTDMGLTQDELAAAMTAAGHPTKLNVLSRIELGERQSVTVDELAALSHALGTPTSTLLKDPNLAVVAELVWLIDERDDWQRRLDLAAGRYESQIQRLDEKIDAELEAHPKAKAAVERLRK